MTIATIGLNPSDCEITGGYLPSDDDMEAQWKAQQAYFNKPYRRWFDRAEAVLCAASAGRLSYGGKYGPIANAVHLDVSPLPTVGKFDTVFGKAAFDRKEAAIQMLNEDSAGILFPLLELLHRDHSLSNVVVFGFSPPDGGSSTMKRLWGGKSHWKTTPEEKEKVEGKSGSIQLGRASPTASLSDSNPAIPKLNWLFMSKGPSARCPTEDLQTAAAKVGSRGWLVA